MHIGKHPLWDCREVVTKIMSPRIDIAGFTYSAAEFTSVREMKSFMAGMCDRVFFTAPSHLPLYFPFVRSMQRTVVKAPRDILIEARLSGGYVIPSRCHRCDSLYAKFVLFFRDDIHLVPFSSNRHLRMTYSELLQS